RMGKRSLRRIGEESKRDFGATHAVCLRAMVARDRPLRLVRSFELVIVRGLTEQVVDGWRDVVHRRHIDADNLLFGIKLVAWAQLESREALAIHADEMQSILGDFDRNTLHGMSVATREE